MLLFGKILSIFFFEGLSAINLEKNELMDHHEV